MSNETDLDWLARTEHCWPEDAIYVSRHENAVEWHYVELSFKGRGHFTKDQWLARRAELQNKPSWEDAPEWADWLAQDIAGLDGLGAWWWYRMKPTKGDRTWSSKGHSSRPAPLRGEVLGNWRDTLERRPADLSEQAVTARLQEATDNVLAAVPELKSDRFKFDPFISIEDNQEKDMKQDNGWFERGELLPPVGAWCEASCEGAEPEKCKVLAYHKTQVAVQWSKFNQGCLDVLEMPGWEFRPLRTERDKAIGEMKIILNAADFTGTVHSTILQLAEIIYDAGYRKESK